MKFKAVVFDLDGTLLNTLDDLADSMNAALANNGFPVHEVEAYKYFVGNGMRNLVINALPKEERNDINIEKGLTGLLTEYKSRWDKKSMPYDGIPQLLDTLIEKNIKITVLSNKADDFAGIVVEKLLHKWKFDIVFGERSGIPRKPDPAVAIEIAGLLGVDPKECLYLGDTGVDMRTAVSARMYPVGVLWGFRKAEELVENGARVLIAEPMTLIDLL